MDNQTSQEVVPTETIDIVRDSTFARFVADKGVVFVLGRDVEVGFLQYGPTLTSQTDLGELESMQIGNIVTEVARMRMGLGEFLSMTMNFLKEGIQNGRLKGDGIVQSIAEWAEAANAVGVDPKDKG